MLGVSPLLQALPVDKLAAATAVAGADQGIAWVLALFGFLFKTNPASMFDWQQQQQQQLLKMLSSVGDCPELPWKEQWSGAAKLRSICRRESL